MPRYLRLDLPTLSQQIIEVSLITIFFLVPLIFVPFTSELFEFNKMILVYSFSVVILVFEIIKLLSTPKPAVTLPRLWWAWLLFMAALTLTTLTSIDTHLSIFGYYGRFHGGLWSWLSYAIIFYSLSQRSKEFFFGLVKISLVSGAIIALWGILEHFGHSPSCLVLTSSFDAACWVQNVQARVFATIGHPNWLAAYLAMLLPWSLSFYLQARRWGNVTLLFFLNILLFTCFIFTYSRGGSAGLIAGTLVWLVFSARLIKTTWRRLLPLGLAVIVLTVIFASPFTPQLLGTTPYRAIGTLEGGDETGKIRLVVWQGAWEIFKHNPILGTGPETFGESFYQFRPVEMNKTGEWDFLFNKAHNEYLNYLSTTGIIGTSAYLLLFLVFFWQGRRFLKKETHVADLVFAGGLGSTASFLIQNIFGFSVVPLVLLLVLNLTSINSFEEKNLIWRWSKTYLNLQKYRLALILILPLMLALMTIFNLWRADILYAQGAGDNETEDSEKAERSLLQAVRLNPTEPQYQIQLAFAEASLATQFGQTTSGEALLRQAQDYARLATQISPRQLSLWRLQGQIFEELGRISPDLLKDAEDAKKEAVRLAPTEPKVRLELASFYLNRGRKVLALENFQSAYQLKDDYLEPLLAIVKIYLEQGDTKQAKIYLDKARLFAPNNPEVLELSKKVGS